MSYLRQNGYMLAYAGVAEADKVELNGDTLLIEAKQGSSASGLVDEANKLAIEKFAASIGVKLNLIVEEDDEQKIINKLKELIGSKLKFEE